MINFTEEQIQRYSRQILLKDVGVEGHKRILSSNVLIIDAGGLGAPAALYLAAVGVGTLGIVDGDSVDLSNLYRQIIHFTPDLGLAKVDSAAAKIRALNPDVKMVAYHEPAVADNIRDIIRGYDFVIDGTDKFAAKFLINDACILEKIPYSHGGILEFTGQTLTVAPGESACYRCIFTAPPPNRAIATCSQAGVLGSIKAAEALKFKTSAGTPLYDQLLTFDAGTMDFRKVAIRKWTDCPVCGKNPSIVELHDEEEPAFICSGSIYE